MRTQRWLDPSCFAMPLRVPTPDIAALLPGSPRLTHLSLRRCSGCLESIAKLGRSSVAGKCCVVFFYGVGHLQVGTRLFQRKSRADRGMGVGVVATRSTDAAPVVGHFSVCLFVFARPSGPAAINLGSAVGGVGSGLGLMCISQSRSAGAITGNARCASMESLEPLAVRSYILPHSHLRAAPVDSPQSQGASCNISRAQQWLGRNLLRQCHFRSPSLRQAGRALPACWRNRVRDAVEERHDSVRH